MNGWRVPLRQICNLTQNSIRICKPECRIRKFLNDNDKNATSLDNESADVSAQLSDPPISNATAQIDNKVEANNSCGVGTTESVDNSAETPVEPSSVQC